MDMARTHARGVYQLSRVVKTLSLSPFRTIGPHVRPLVLSCRRAALLHRRAVLVLDEATSNLDEQTDAAIQRLLRGQFGGMTVLTIAHRLVTVIDYDTILVMGGGRLLEAGAPSELLRREDGALRSMAAALGSGGQEMLLQRVKA